jgi:hypothetical protein
MQSHEKQENIRAAYFRGMNAGIALSALIALAILALSKI